MQKLAIAVAAVATLASTSIFAADMAVKAPPAPPVAVWSWIGFYIGVNAGGSIGRDPTTQSAGAPINAVLGSFTLSPAGFVGGGQIGYNYLFAPNWLIGVEGDVQGASQSDSSCVGDCSFVGISAFTLNDTQKVKWFATARARLGYTDGDWLWYVTGGGAWGEVHNDLKVFINLLDIAGSANFNQSGWVMGGGVETHLGGPWTAKLEYLYLDLSSLTDVAVQSRITFTSKSNIRDHIIRAGLNYKFI
jgi:outer membrane immunogenic protein